MGRGVNRTCALDESTCGQPGRALGVEQAHIGARPRRPLVVGINGRLLIHLDQQVHVQAVEVAAAAAPEADECLLQGFSTWSSQ